MKIGLARRGYSATGGAERYLRRFAETAGAAGHECLLFGTEDWPGHAWNGEIVRLGGGSPRAFADELEKASPQSRCDFLFSFERVWSCDAYRAGDGVHAVWLERRAQFEPRWRSFLRRFDPKHRSLLQLEKNLFGARAAGVVVANSNMVRHEIEQHYGYPAEQIRVVYNGVPAFTPTETARAEVRRELGLDETGYVLLFAGSGWERKGLRFAVEAMKLAHSPGAVLLVAGRGNPRSVAPARCVRFLGPRNDIPRLLAAADAFLLPTWYDAFSNACLEALAAGLPVITTRHNGFAELIASGTDGEIVGEACDVDALARAIERWASPKRRHAERPRLQALGACFSLEENVRQTLSVLLSIKPGSSSRRPVG